MWAHPQVRPRGSLFDPGAELGERRFLRKASGRGANTRWNPFREGHLLSHVMSRTRVHLPHLREAIRWQVARRSDKSRPQPPMDKCDLALDKATHEHIVAVADRSRHREDLTTLRMGPPATPKSLSSNDLSKRWDWPVRGLEDNTVLMNESESLEWSHRHVVSVGPTTLAVEH